MDEPAAKVNQLRQWPAIPSQTAGAVSAGKEKDDLDGEFKQLLTAVLLGMSMPGETGSSSSSAAGMGSIMAPLMLNLIERLLEKEVQSDQSAAGQPGGPIPQGLPIHGRLTQSSRAGHMALDYSAPVGTPVHTTMDGKVVYAGWNNQGYGNLVIVENGPYRTYYAHLSDILVSDGQPVQANTLIARSGNTGNSTGPHLHYEVRMYNRQVDPANFTKN